MRKIKKNKKAKFSAGVFLSISMIVVGAGITVAANSFSLSGLQARSMEKRIEALAEENKSLELKATNLKSLQAIKGSTAAQEELVQVKNLKHIKYTGVPREDSVSSN